MTKLDIFSDPVCPWCMIGKAHLDRALAAHPEHVFEIEWHPFQLNPGMPPQGVDRAEYLAAKFGGQDGAVSVYARVEEAAAAAGVLIDFSRIKIMPNTFDAHRMIYWAGLEGKQTAMISAIFRAYWQEGRDIGNAASLAAIAGEIGLDSAAMARLLASDADRGALQARETNARERGVNAVPTFVIANQYVVSGAQPPEVWGQVIEELSAQLTTRPTLI